MFLESFARAFWPAGACLAVFWSAIAFGAAADLDRVELLSLMGVAVLVILGLVVWGFRKFHWPSHDDAVTRLDGTLPGHPLAALNDVPALGGDDPAVQSVWAVHMERMRAVARGARAVPADLNLSRQDPWAMRLAAVVCLIAAVIFARNTEVVETLVAGVSREPAAIAATGPEYEGWAEPPAYTGRPTLYMPEISGDGPVNVPQGTIVTLRVYGSTERFALSETVSGAEAAPLAEAADGIAIAEFEVRVSGEVVLDRSGDTVGSWSFGVIDDAPPGIEVAGEVTRGTAGELTLPFAAEDDYGVETAQAEITLDLGAVDRRYGNEVEPEPRDPLVVDLPLPLSGQSEEIRETLAEDFSTHAWVGLPVTIRLTATDAAGQTGGADVAVASMPGKNFYDPMAAALAELRRDLMWSVENGQRVEQVLRAVTHRPDDFFHNASAYLITRTALRRLSVAVDAGDVPGVREEVQDALWKAAMLLEDGSLGDAAERLARARERLQQALRNGASDEEIAQLMDELRDATRNYMEQMAREALERGDMEMAESDPGQSMSQDQIQELMDRIQELSEQGRRAEAEALLDMLQQLLDNMEMRFAQGGGQGQQGQGDQSMQEMMDALRQQQGLADESFQELQREFGQSQQPGEGQPGQGQGQQGQQPGGSQGGTAQGLSERQQALRDLVEGLGQGLPGIAGEDTRQALRDAEESMGQAADDLAQGDLSGALDNQSDAIDALRDGIGEFAQDQRQAAGQGQGNEGNGTGPFGNNQSIDPLGRSFGADGPVGTREHMLPDADSAARARELLDEIRRRSGDQSRPQIELDYLKRLLDRF